MIVEEWIRQSNLIEGVDDTLEDERSQKAWEWLKNIKKKKFNLSTVCQLQDKIMKKKLKKMSRGRWRRVGVRVGNRICMPFQMVPTAMRAWLTQYDLYVTEEGIKRAHIEFEKIHPFVDGNGRTGRMIMNWQRVRAGFEPLHIKFSDRWAYYAWFQEESSS